MQAGPCGPVPSADPAPPGAAPPCPSPTLPCSIPPAWALPSSLEDLSLDMNGLTGSLAPEWRLPETLQHLGLAFNRLEGEVPSNWTLPVLASAWLNDNTLQGAQTAGCVHGSHVHGMGLLGDAGRASVAAGSSWLVRFEDLQGPQQEKHVPPAKSLDSPNLPDPVRPPPNLASLHKTAYCSLRVNAGPVPVWDVPTDAQVIVAPQNSTVGVCGEVRPRRCACCARTLLLATAGTKQGSGETITRGPLLRTPLGQKALLIATTKKPLRAHTALRVHSALGTHRAWLACTPAGPQQP